MVHRVTPDEFADGVTFLDPTDLPYEAGLAAAANPSQLRLYSIDKAGQLLRPIETIENIDVRDRPWYRCAVETDQPGWSEPFQIGASNLLSLNAYAPVYDEAQQLVGVFSVNVSLNKIADFLSTLNIGQTGEAFIIERNGLLIADSTGAPPYTSSVRAYSSFVTQPGGAFKRIKAGQRANPLIRAAAEQTLRRDTTAESDTQPAAQPVVAFEIDGDRHFLQVIPYQDSYGLDWQIVTVVPASDFMGDLESTTDRVILFCLVATLGAVVASIYIARKITQPIVELSKTVRAFTVGRPFAIDGSTSPHALKIQEVEHLKQSFGQMATQLDESFQSLKESEERFHTLFDSVPIGISVVDVDGQVLFANKTGNRIVGRNVIPTAEADIPQAYSVYVAGTSQLYSAEQLPSARARRGEAAHADDLEIQMGDRRVPLEVEATPIMNEAGDLAYMLVMFRDISERREVERLRDAYQRDLERQVAAQTQALEQSEAQFRDILNSAGASIAYSRFYPDRRYVNLYHSIGCFSMTGFTPAELSADVFLSHIPLEDVAKVSEPIYEAVFKEEPITVEYRFLHKDGSTRWISDTVTSRWNEAEGCWMVTMVGIDVTAQKQAELALRESEERFQNIASTISQMFFMRSAQTGQFLYVNPAYEQIWGRTCQSLYDDPDSWMTSIHPDDRPLIDQSVKRQFEGNSVTREYRIVRDDGETRWIFAQIEVVRDDAGHPARFIGFAVDITDRKRAEIALQRSQAELQLITDSVPGAISYVDASQRYRFVNETYEIWFNYQKAEVIGKTVRELIGEEAYRLTHHYVERALAGETVVYEAELPYSRGPTRWISAILVPDVDDHVHVQGYYVLATDITARKQAEFRLAAALAEKDALVQEIYHRVKNNLQLIQSLLRMQQRRLNDSDAIQSLQESCDRIMAISLLHNILYRSPNLTQIDLPRYIQSVVHQVAVSYAAKASTVELQLQLQPVHVSARQAMACGLILNELVSNAFKHGFPEPAPGVIAIELALCDAEETRHAGGDRSQPSTATPTVVMRVRNDGAPLPESFDISTIQSLGLSLVQDFVTQLNGTLQVTSGDTTQFQVTFPVAGDRPSRGLRDIES